MDAQQQVARTVVAGHVAHAIEEVVLQQDRVAGRARVGRPRGVDAVAAGVDHAPDCLWRQPRLVAERDHDRLAVGQLGEAGGERGRLALVPALGDDQPGALCIHAGSHLLRRGSEHHDHALDL